MLLMLSIELLQELMLLYCGLCNFETVSSTEQPLQNQRHMVLYGDMDGLPHCVINSTDGKNILPL